MLLTRPGFGGAQNRGWMHGCNGKRGVRRLDGLPMQTAHAEIFSEERLRSGRSRTHEYLWLDRLKLSFQPGRASLALGLTRLLVNTSLTALRCRPLEMFNDVCDVNGRAIDANLGQCLIEQFSGRPHEWSSHPVS